MDENKTRKVCFDTNLKGFPRFTPEPTPPSTSTMGKGDMGSRMLHDAEQTIPNDTIFYQDPNVLLRRDRMTEFYPAQHLEKTRKINAIARFTVYFAILYFFATGNAFLPLIGLVGLYLLAKCVLPQWIKGETKQNGGLGYGFGACCSQDDQVIDRCAPKPRKTRPTCDNPFMNPTVNDFMTSVDRSPAPSITQEPVASQINDLFTERLYLDIDDIWQRQNGQRQFVTNPSTTIPNDQEGFARFLFDNSNHACRESYICKNDIRFNHTGPTIGH